MTETNRRKRIIASARNYLREGIWMIVAVIALTTYHFTFNSRSELVENNERLIQDVENLSNRISELGTLVDDLRQELTNKETTIDILRDSLRTFTFFKKETSATNNFIANVENILDEEQKLKYEGVMTDLQKHVLTERDRIVFSSAISDISMIQFDDYWENKLEADYDIGQVNIEKNIIRLFYSDFVSRIIKEVGHVLLNENTSIEIIGIADAHKVKEDARYKGLSIVNHPYYYGISREYKEANLRDGTLLKNEHFAFLRAYHLWDVIREFFPSKNITITVLEADDFHTRKAIVNLRIRMSSDSHRMLPVPPGTQETN